MIKTVMVRAWAIARAAVAKFGGKVREYFAAALRQAWAEARAPKASIATPPAKGANRMVNEWVNAKGSKIELHTTHITEETWKDDWDQVHVKKVDSIIIDKVVIDGRPFIGQGISRKAFDKSTNVIDLGSWKIDGEMKHVKVMIPSEIDAKVWGEYDARQKAKAEARARARKAEEAELKKMVANGYCTKCHSYCYGDCSA